jgi:hypothetical protein
MMAISSDCFENEFVVAGFGWSVYSNAQLSSACKQIEKIKIVSRGKQQREVLPFFQFSGGPKAQMAGPLKVS